MSDERFGLSTRPFLGERLDDRHLDLIGRHGFDAIEVVAQPSHFDPSDLTAAPRLATWLAARSMQLYGMVVAPERSLASNDAGERTRALDDVSAVLALAREVPFHHLVVSMGGGGNGSHSAAGARQSLQALGAAAAAVGVRVAVEVSPHPVSRPDALVRLIEGELEDHDIGICLDFGQAHLMGDLADAIELVSGHVISMHLSDNRRRTDDHLPPFAGTIDWDAAMMAMLKIGYEGRLILDVAASGTAADTLARCADARARLARAVDWVQQGP